MKCCNDLQFLETMKRILIEEGRFGGLPGLHACPLDLAEAPLPTVIVWHGFTRSKEIDSNLAYMFAHAGLRVLMPEADGHGERLNRNPAAKPKNFWEILRSCIDEMPTLRDALMQRGLVQDGRIAVAGLSMGGFAALGALARYEWLCAGVSWMGSAYFLDLARTLHPPMQRYDASTADNHESHMLRLNLLDPSTTMERLANRPLLLWHGVRDEVVPFSESARLYADMVKQGLAERLEFVVDPQASHKLPMAGALAGVNFLTRIL